MHTTINPDYLLCEHVGRKVSISHTEGGCRDRNRCDAQACPLEGKFGRESFGVMTQRLSGAIGSSWLGN